MIDSVLKGTGNSRFLKSAVPAGTSWADALAMLQAGTFPIDFNGINTEGFQQVGTPLNKANLLKDATAAQIGLPPSTTPDGMFQALGNTGELHVWKKTVTLSEEKPAGYTFGAEESNVVFKASRDAFGVADVANSVSVGNDGSVGLVNPATDQRWSSVDLWQSNIRGKFVKFGVGSSGYITYAIDGIFYITPDAVVSKSGLNLMVSGMKRITGYPLTPAGTTTTYPVSTNPNAYQEGDDAKEAGYVVGDVETGQFSLGVTVDSSAINRYNYSSAITVNDAGVVLLSNSTPIEINGGNSAQNNDEMAKIIGKYISLERVGDSNHPPDFDAGVVWCIPADATHGNKGSYPNNINYITKRQPVIGYAAIPAGTTIEYLGKLGDKARVQVVSYVGTGTYGESNPCSITADFKIKVAIYLKSEDWYQSSSKWVEIADDLKTRYQQAHGFVYGQVYNAFGKRSSDSKTITWYNTYSNSAQLNVSGEKYTFLVIG